MRARRFAFSGVAGRTQAVFLFALSLSAVWMRAIPQDGFFCLDMGRYIAGHGLPRTNVFTSVAAGASWVDTQWVSQLVMYDAWRLAGYPGVVITAAISCAVAWVLLVKTLGVVGVSPERAVLFAVIAGALAAPAVTLRAQTFALPLFAGVLLLLARAIRQGRLTDVALTLPLLAVWANVHGSVLLGATLVGCYSLIAACQQLVRRHVGAAAALAIVAGAAFMSPFTIPYGIGETFHYYASTVGNPAFTDLLWEWQAPTVSLSLGFFFFVPLFALLFILGVGFGRGYRPAWGFIVLAVITAAAATQAVRFYIWFVLVAVIVSADIVERTASPLAQPPAVFRRAATALAVATTIGTVVLLIGRPSGSYESAVSPTPVSIAGKYAVGHPRAKILADDVVTNFLTWRYPQLHGRVAFDARFEQYTLAEQVAYANWAVAGPGWLATTRSYQIMVAAQSHPALIVALRSLNGWRAAYDGPQGIVVTRTSPPTG